MAGGQVAGGQVTRWPGGQVVDLSRVVRSTVCPLGRVMGMAITWADFMNLRLPVTPPF